MKHLITFAIFFCMLSPLLKAQIDQSPIKNSFGRNHLTLADIDGSPYLESEYKVGSVITVDDVFYKDIPLRYNCFDDGLEFLKDNVAYDLKPKEKIKKAEFGGQIFVYRDFEPDGGINKSFFQLLVEGKASLYARFNIKFYEAEELKGFADPKPARFDDLSETYYISINNSPAKKISNNKKLLEILAAKQKDVESFISKQKLSVKKSADLKKIIAYYNSL